MKSTRMPYLLAVLTAITVLLVPAMARDEPQEQYLDIVGAWSPMAAGLKPGLVKFTNNPGTIK